MVSVTPSPDFSKASPENHVLSGSQQVAADFQEDSFRNFTSYVRVNEGVFVESMRILVEHVHDVRLRELEPDVKPGRNTISWRFGNTSARFLDSPVEGRREGFPFAKVSEATVLLHGMSRSEGFWAHFDETLGATTLSPNEQEWLKRTVESGAAVFDFRGGRSNRKAAV